MFIFNAIGRGWRSLLAAFEVGDHQTLLTTLCAAYRAEVNAVAQCRQHADQMIYPQFRAELLRIAAEIQMHLPWLQEQILALGGSPPSSFPWMDHERMAWEIEGKQTSWAEWAGEQEFKWVTELPHHDREWAQHLATQRETEMHQIMP